MKRYNIFVDYGLEGWKIEGQTDDFDEAVEYHFLALRNGHQTWIFKPVFLDITEAIEE